MDSVVESNAKEMRAREATNDIAEPRQSESLFVSVLSQCLRSQDPAHLFALLEIRGAAEVAEITLRTRAAAIAESGVKVT